MTVSRNQRHNKNTATYVFINKKDHNQSIKKDHTGSSIKQLSFINRCFTLLFSCLLVTGDYSLVIESHETAEVKLSIGRGLNNEGESLASLRIPTIRKKCSQK